jgi:hypothetical protein
MVKVKQLDSIQDGIPNFFKTDKFYIRSRKDLGDIYLDDAKLGKTLTEKKESLIKCLNICKSKKINVVDHVYESFLNNDFCDDSIGIMDSAIKDFKSLSLIEKTENIIEIIEKLSNK